MKSYEIYVKYFNMKVQVYHCSSHHHMFTTYETDLALHNTIFSLVCCTRQELHANTSM